MKEAVFKPAMDAETRRKVEHFTVVWDAQRALPVEKKNAMGVAYLRHIIGANDSTIDAFLTGYGGHGFVGRRQGGSEPKRNDYASFWDDVAGVVPGMYAADDINWLTKHALEDGAYMMLLHTDTLSHETSPVLYRINVNAHAYK